MWNPANGRRAYLNILARSIPTAPGNIVTSSKPSGSLTGSCRQNNSFGHDDGMILRFRRRHVQRPRDPLAVWFLDQILRVVAHRENRWFGRCYFTISDLQENIPRPKSRDMSWPTFVNILKHPPLRAIEVATHERCADCVASRDFRTLRVSNSRVTGFASSFSNSCICFPNSSSVLLSQNLGFPIFR